jgi:hypothetical protein
MIVKYMNKLNTEIPFSQNLNQIEKKLIIVLKSAAQNYQWIDKKCLCGCGCGWLITTDSSLQAT